MVMLTDKSSCIKDLRTGFVWLVQYINHVDPYAYKSSSVDYASILINKDQLSVHDAYYMSCCAGVGPTKYVDGTILNVVDNGHSYAVYYVPACSKYDVMGKFEDKYRDADPVLMDTIVDYFWTHDDTHLYAYRKYGRVHYGVLQGNNSVYEGTINYST